MKNVFAKGALTVALAAASLPATALTITYTDFSDLSDFTLNGSAAAIGNPVSFGGQDVLRLTNGLGQGGSAFLTTPISLASDASFSSFFSFQITDPIGISDVDGQGADGIVFAVQTLSSSVGGAGGGIGYGGILDSVGVEFDTWNNGAVDDSSGNHIGVDLGGSVDSLGSVTPVAVRMNNGSVWYAWVDYDGSTDNLEVRLSESDPTRPALALIDITVDLVAELGSTSVFAGFTSGTGSAGGDHDIRSWTLVNEFAPIGGGGGGTVPEPATLALIGMGFAGMSGALRRRGIGRR